METAQLFFSTSSAGNDESVRDKIHSYLAALLHNGQIVGDYTLAKVNGGYLATASLADAGALGQRANNHWVRKTTKELKAAGVAAPKTTRLGPDPDSRPACRCKKWPFLVLVASFLHDESPVRALRRMFRFRPVVSVTRDRRRRESSEPIALARHVQAFDWLFIASGAGERFAHDQLSRADSEFSREGRELARALEKVAQVPVYYYLYKHVGRSDRMERRRVCPSCGSGWLRKERLHGIFDFQCRRCRLLSNVAFDVRL